MSSSDWIPASEYAEYCDCDSHTSDRHDGDCSVRDHISWNRLWQYHREADRRIAEQAALIQDLADTLEQIQDACFDHACGLEGYDATCSECVAVKALRAATLRVAEYQTRSV